MNRSMAPSSSDRLLVKSCAASVRPLVCSTAARSFAPTYRSTNCLAAFLTSVDRSALVCRSSRTSTKMRPSKSRALVRTSGSIAVGRNSGRSARSTGMSTSENTDTACGLPSSSSWKSSFVRSRTRWPRASVTMASTST